jgi:hypothetical protein
MTTSAPFRTIDDVLEYIDAFEQRGFHDNEWVARYTVTFAGLYRSAIEAYDRGERVPKSWKLALDTAKEQTGLISQDLLLGINAHVNHDLALALDTVSIEPDRASRHQDHTAVNQVLHDLTDVVSDRVSQLYAPGLAGVDACAGRLDEDATNFSFTIARENAWEAAVALANARNTVERLGVTTLLDLRAAAMARLILAPNRNPAVMAACRQVEAGGWWKALSGIHIAVS